MRGCKLYTFTVQINTLNMLGGGSKTKEKDRACEARPLLNKTLHILGFLSVTLHLRFPVFSYLFELSHKYWHFIIWILSPKSASYSPKRHSNPLSDYESWSGGQETKSSWQRPLRVSCELGSGLCSGCPAQVLPRQLCEGHPVVLTDWRGNVHKGHL